MRLAQRYTVTLVLGILLVIGCYDLFAVQAGRSEFEAHMADTLALISRGLSIDVAEVARASGDAQAQRLIGARNGQSGDIRTRWVRFDAPPGDARRPVVDAARLAALTIGSEFEVVRGKLAGDERMYVYRPFRQDGPVRDLIEVSESLRPVRDQVHRSLVGILIKSGLVVVLGGAAALALGLWMIGRPIRVLIEQSRRVGEGDLSARVNVGRHDELSALGAAMNTMCERLDETQRHLSSETAARIAALEQLRHADRLKTVGQLASGVAHELGTPLNVVAGYAKVIAAGDASPDETLEGARIIGEQTARITAIIRQLLDFARRGRPHLEAGDLRAVAERTARMLSALAKARRVEIALDLGAAPALVEMDANQIQQALTNVVANGVQAMPDGGTLRVALSHERRRPAAGGEERDAVRLSVIDEGVGIAPADLERVFEPFFTTKEIGEGTGLGLSVAWGIVEEHGGWIAVESEPGKGSRFSLFLPAATAREVAA